ncbi:MAG: hypothetical protein RI988_4068 [Pseudomonadota bacterium]
MDSRNSVARWRVRRGHATAMGAWRLLVLAAAGALAGPAAALPMASQGFVMVMGEAEEGSSKFSANYAFTGRDALGVATARFDSPAHGSMGMHSSRELGALTYTRLVHRWNLPHAQANLWFVGQLGALRGEGLTGGTRTLLSPAVLADWETTRLYVGGGAEAMRAGDWRRQSAYARTGFSLYEVEYEQVQPWLLLEARRERERIPRAGGPAHEASKTEWMPMVRLIHRQWFLELGARRGSGHLSFMWVP